ncbi:MAG: ATP-dependent protease subunit HslV [Fusobacteriaceae bacterium]
MDRIKATTIIGIKKNGKIALAGDGQVTFGETVFKNNAKKIRRIENYDILTGFAGTASDAFALLEKFEAKLEENSGNVKKAAVELAKDWRNDKILRTLEAMLIVADKENLLMVSGTGDVIETDDNVVAIGSGANYASAAAKALIKFTKLSAEQIALESMKIAGDMCIFTNTNITVETI